MSLPIYPMERPKTRGECYDMPRPCPFVSCKWHLAHMHMGEGYSISKAQAEDAVRETGSRYAASRALGVTRTVVDTALKRQENTDDEIVDLISEMPQTCVLDVADAGGVTTESVAVILGIARQSAEYLIKSAAGRLDQDESLMDARDFLAETSHTDPLLYAADG